MNTDNKRRVLLAVFFMDLQELLSIQREEQRRMVGLDSQRGSSRELLAFSSNQAQVS
jgi:hypothetical protein